MGGGRGIGRERERWRPQWNGKERKKSVLSPRGGDHFPLSKMERGENDWFQSFPKEGGGEGEERREGIKGAGCALVKGEGRC